MKNYIQGVNMNENQNKEIFNIKKDDFIYFLERDELPFPASMIAGGFSDLKNAKDYFGISQEVLLMFKNFEVFAVKSHMTGFIKQFQEKLKQDNYISSVVKDNLEAGNELLSYTKTFEVSFENFKNQDLADKLEDYYHKNKRYCGYYLVVLFQKALTDLAHNLAKKYKTTEYSEQEVFNLITSPSKLTSAEKEVDDFLKICIEYQDKKDINAKANEHAKKYGWLALRYFKGNLWTGEQIKNRVELYRNNAREELESRIKSRDRREQKLKDVFALMNSKEHDLISQIRDIVYLRTKRAEFVDESSAQVLNFVEEIARRLNFSREELIHCVPQEIAAKLRGEDIDLDKIIKERQKGYLMFLVSGGPATILTGNDVAEYVNKHPVLAKQSLKEVKQLEGTTAFAGRVVGTVRVVKDAQDLHKVKAGDVLVAVMTFPHFIVAMERAAAFVTDEGGILCHAAIVSREMKKPCVIGTKIATKVFQDGEMVEVDAENAIVKKYER